MCVNINGADSELLVDSGAAVTVISAELFDKIPADRRPQLKNYDGKIKLEAANSELITVKGKATSNFCIG